MNRPNIVHEASPYTALGVNGVPRPEPAAAPRAPQTRPHDGLAPERAGAAWFIAALWTLKLTAIAALCGVAYGFQRLTRARPAQELQGIWLCRFLLAMGPLAIKVGQVLGAHANLLPRPVLQRLQTLQDDVPATRVVSLRKTLAPSFGEPLENTLLDWEDEPVASASIAQVHRARLHSGRYVALKVVRRGVRTQLERSLLALEALARLAQACSRTLHQLDLVGHLAELRAILLSQCDMRLEAAQQARIRANFAGHPHVHVPEPLLPLCTRDVLVMEWVQGIRSLESHKVDVAPDLLARRLQDAFYTMAYLHGCFHADPHPGNVQFTRAGKIVFLDFGLVGTLSELHKWGLSSFYYAASRKEWAVAVDRFTKHFVVDGERALGERSYRGPMQDVLRKHFEEHTDRWSSIAFVEDANQVLRRHGLRLTTAFTKLVLAFLSGEGLVALIDPEIDIWANARRFTDRASPYMSDAVEDRFERCFREAMPSSLDWRERAAGVLVAPTHLDRYMVPSIYPLFVQRAHGSRLIDLDGNEYIDLHCGFGAQFLGHAHPALVEALTLAAQAGSVNAIGHRAEVELAEELVSALPSAERVIFANSGTEAVLHAVRLCKAARNRAHVAKFEGHYHGFSDQGLVSSWFAFAGLAEHPEPVAGMPGTDRSVAERTLVLQYGSELSLERVEQHADELACVICEPFPSAQAECNVAFLRGLREVCDRHGIPLVFDEVVSGFRVAFGGAQVLAGVHPDLTCLGKIIGGGLPCAAVVGRRELIELAKSSRDPFKDLEQKVFVGGTMSGNSLACSAGLAAIRYLKEHHTLYADVHERTRRLGDGLARTAAEQGIAYHVSAARSIVTMTFDYRKPKLVREQQAGSNYRANLALAYYMRRHGIYMPELHTMLLCAEHSDEDVAQIVEAFALSLREMTHDGLFAS